MSAQLDAQIKGSLPSGLPASTVLTPEQQSEPISASASVSASTSRTPSLSPTSPAASTASSPTSSSPILSPRSPHGHLHPHHPPALPGNPLDAAPSSPQQIYLNLLILEASLRSQYLTLTLRRRKYTFFFLLLVIWTTYFFLHLFILPNGPSPYYYISLLQKLSFLAGAVTLGLFYLSGLYKRTLVYPRKFVGNTNKGLRQFGIRLVAVKVGFWERIMGWLVIFPIIAWWCPHSASLPYIPPGEMEKTRSFKEIFRSVFSHGNHHGPSTPSPPMQQQTPSKKSRRNSHLPPVSGLLITPSSSRMPTPPPPSQTDSSTISPSMEEESYQPSGSHVKLVILPKGFSPDFREGWEIYRTEYWERENERRAALRAQLKAAKKRGWRSAFGRKEPLPTSAQQQPQPEKSTEEGSGGGSKSPARRISKRTSTPDLEPRGSYHYHSRSPTPDISTPTPQGTPPADDGPSPPVSRPRPRRGSTASLTNVKRRPLAGGTPTPPPSTPGGGSGAGSGLRSEFLLGTSEGDGGDVSDAGSVRSLAGSVEGGTPGKKRGRKTRGGAAARRRGGGGVGGESGVEAGGSVGGGGDEGDGRIEATGAAGSPGRGKRTGAARKRESIGTIAASAGGRPPHLGTS